ncbi:hypothetical protein BLNAU_9319 [Blattamonas nauphoetae]|uniref:Uncharacterized protein n=1 Tax=Blattamonas nauphoetae TaxID=2049346 RepID=A0ABQ9XWD1_9EUKA|nr:hypothetical protein BLNAU_9319 [Blattamonas nauphoetae]
MGVFQFLVAVYPIVYSFFSPPPQLSIDLSGLLNKENHHHSSEDTNEKRVELTSSLYHSSDLLIHDCTTILSGTNKTTIIHKSDVTNSKRADPLNLFLCSNSSLSIFKVTINLETDSQPGERDSDLYCGVIKDSSFSAQNCDFMTSSGTPIFLISTEPLSTKRHESVLTLTACTITNSKQIVTAISTIDHHRRSSMSSAVRIVSCHFSNMEMLSQSGIAYSNSVIPQLCSVLSELSTCSFHNITSSTRSYQIHKSIASERVIGSHLSHVDNALYGSVTSALGCSQEFLAANTTLLNCANSENTDGTTFTAESHTYTFTGNSTRFEKKPGVSTHLFKNCTFVVDKPSVSYTALFFPNYTGILSISGSKFDFQTLNSVDNPLLYFEGEINAFPTLLIDKTSATISRDGTRSANHQISILKSVNAYYVSSNFTHHASASQTGYRLILSYSGCDLHTFSNCQITGQSSDTNGAVLSQSNSIPIVYAFDSLFESNFVRTSGGCFNAYHSQSHFQRCVFRGNTATNRGGAIHLDYPSYVRLEDTHFDDNTAHQKFSTTGELTHYRGNDIAVISSNLNVFTAAGAIIGCTSSSVAPKFGYYADQNNNGNLTTENTYLQEPSPTLPKAAGVWAVADGGVGDCSITSPCATIAAAFTKIKESPSKISFQSVNLKCGDFTLSNSDLPSSFELVGMGWTRDSSTFTTIKSEGISLATDTNCTLRAVSLFPSSKTVTAIAMTSSATLYLTNINSDGFSDQEVSLFAFSAGNATLHQCMFDQITLKDCPLIHISGPTTVRIVHVWFTRIKRTVGTGASCIDSTTTSSLKMHYTDCGTCSSVGRAGCFDLSTTNSSESLQVDVYFSNNRANSGNNPLLLQTANDMFVTGYSKPTLTGSRSISPTDQVVQNGDTVRLQYIGLGFHDYGMNHPIAPRFERATPISQMVSLKAYVLSLPESTNEIIALIHTSTPLKIEPIEFSNKYVTIRHCPLNATEQSDTAFFTVRSNAHMKIFQTPTTVNFSLAVPLAHLISSNSTFTSYMMTYTIADVLHTSPFFMADQGRIVFFQTTFTRGVKMDGCAFIHSTGSEVSFDQSSFPSFSSNYNGSIVHSVGASITSYKSTFTSCSAVHGGAFYITLSGSKAITITHDKTSTYQATFSNCSAVGETGTYSVPQVFGGAIYVKGTSTATQPIRFSTSVSNDARFEKNLASEGSDVYIEKDLFQAIATESLKSLGGGSYSEEFRIVIEGRTSTPTEMETVQTKLLAQPRVSVNGSVVEPITGSSGTDDVNCKWTSSFCATLAYGIKFLNHTYRNGTHIPQNIQYVWNMTYTETAISVTNQSVTLSGTTTSQETTSTVYRSLLEVGASLPAGKPLFTIDKNATFTVKNLDICAIATSGLFELKDDANSLALETVAVICSVDSQYQHALVKSTSKPVTITNCAFNTTKGSTGSAVLSQPLISLSSTTSTFSISKTTFTSFSVSTVPLISIDTQKPITFKTNTFKNITGTPTVTLVLVASSSLKSVVLPSLWTGSFTPTQTFMDFVGRDSNLAADQPFFESSLMFYLLPPTGSIIAGATASHEESEHPECGTDRLRCSSLNSALSSAITHSINTQISVAGTALLSAHLDVKAAASFSSTTGAQTITQSAAGSITLNAAGQTLSFSSLVFDLSPSSTVSTLFTVTAGLFSLTSCSIGTDTPTDLNVACTGLIDVASGATLSLTASTIQNLKFTHPTLGTALLLQSGSSFSSDVGSIFTSVSSNAKGSLIFVHSANLETTSKTSSFSLIKATLQLPVDTLFTVEDKNEFVGQVGSQSPESLLFFWFPHSTTETTLSVDENGEDHPNCGLLQLPCKTLEKGFASLKATGTTLVLNKADTITTTLTTKFALNTIKSTPTAQPISIKPSGALSVSSSHKLTIHTLTFSFESGTRSTPFVKVTAGSLVVTQCSFCSTVPGTTLSSAVFDVKGSLTVDSVNFTQLQTSHTAGLFKLELIDTDTLSFVTTRIEGCTSSVAPLISLSLSSTTQQTNWDFNLNGLSFVATTSNAAPSGVLIFISGSSFETQIVPSRFPPIDAETDQNKFWGSDSSTNVESSLLVYLVQPGSKIDVDGVNGKDIAHCGHFGVSCLTIEKGIGRATAADSAKQITIKDETPLSASISPNAVALTIAGETQMRQIRIESDLQFTVQSDALYLSLLAFTTTVASFSNSLITLTSTGSLTVASCSFSGFSSTAASILTATVRSSQSVIFSDTTFTACNSTGTVRSGVLDVSLVESSDFSVSHSSNPFITCSSSDCSADCVFISHPTLSKTVVDDILKFVWTQTSPSSRDFVGKEGNHAIPVPLSLYFLTLPTSTFISADSNDVSVCGFAEYPCASLTALHTRIKDTADTTITFITNVEHSAELTFTKSVSFTGMEKTMSIKEVAASATNTAFFSLTTSSHITSLFVTVPSTFKHASVFHSLSDSLTIQNCSFTQSGTGCIVGTLIQIKSGASLTLRTTFFVSISSASEKAGVIIADVSDSAAFVLNNNTFTSCSCDGQAHSIFMSLENSTQVTSTSFNYEMKNLVFSKDTSNSNTVKLINVLVTGNRIDLTTKSSDWDGSYSVDIPDSLWGCDTSTGMNTSLLVYLVQPGSKIDVDGVNGKDIEQCGHFGVSCLTIEKGIGRATAADSAKQINIKDATPLSTSISPSTQTLSIAGETQKRQILIAAGGQFVISDGSLTLKLLAFVASVDSFSNSLITLASTGSLSVTSCSFSSFSSTTASILTATVGSSTAVRFSDTTFTTCNSTGTARSGVLDVSMVEGSEFSITHSSNPFITCSSSDCSADCVFISHPTLSKTVVNNILKFGWDQTSPSSRDFVGKEGNHAIPVPLSLYFLTLPTSTFISADSNDVSVCGFAEYPCASLTALHGRIKDTPDTAITFNTNVEHSTELAFTKSVSFSGNEKTMTIKETAATAPGTALFSLAANTQITSLFVAVPSTFKHASVFHSLSASLTIENCSFAQSGTGRIAGTLIQIKSGASLTLRTTFFVSISSASEKAGVIIADVSDSAAFVLNNNTFTSCSCAGQAHSIFISLENTTEVTSSSFNYEMKNLVFSTSSSNSNTVKLINVLVTGNRIDLTTKSDAWEGTYSVDTPDSLWGCDTSTGVNTSLLVYLIQPGSKIDVDGTNGKDIEQCGHFGVSCLTIEKGIGRATAADSAKQINIKDATPLSTSISPNAVALTITGETQMRQIKIAAGGQFVISDGSLTLKLLAFVASVDSFSNSLITVSSTGSLSVTSCSFSGFSSTAASILTATIATSKSVIFSDTTFTTCNSTGTARSGVLDVSMVEGSEFSITHSSNPFITCSSSDCSADCVFVSHPTLSKTVVNNILKFGWDQTSPSSRDFVGKEGNHAIPVPLAVFPHSPTSTFISADSNDVSVCGFAEYPCASLTALHGRIKDTPDTAITFNTNVEHSTELAFTKSVSFSGNEKTMTIKETAATAPGTALFSLAANTQITSLFVAVPSTFKHASVFHSLSASLTIENCSFAQSGTGRIAGTLIQIKSGASLTLRTTFFVSISSASEKAGVIIADVSDSAAFVLNNNTFTSCSCAGQAHSIFIS